jgi:hypothetical protein
MWSISKTVTSIIFGVAITRGARMRTLAKSHTRAARKAPVETAQLAQLLGMLEVADGRRITRRGKLRQKSGSLKNRLF